MFLSLSAFLFGTKWRNESYKGFNIEGFCKKRFLRIFIPLWIVLLVAIPLELYMGHEVSPQMIAFNFWGLGWARPLIWQGHLWYITITLIVYFVFLLISRIRLDQIPLAFFLFALVALSTMIVIFSDVFQTVSKTIIPVTIFYSVMLFSKGDKVQEYCIVHKWLLAFFTIVVLSSSLVFYLCDWHNTHKGIATLSSALAGVFLFLLLFTWIAGKRKSRSIEWLSNCSYEIYLIHPSLLIITSMLIGKGEIQLIVNLLLILFSGYFIHIVSEKIYSWIKSHLV